MARKFLYVIAGLIVLVIAGAFAYRIWGTDLIRMASVPTAAFTPQPSVAPAAYSDAKMWIARPDIGGNPAEWLPPGIERTAQDGRAAAVFYIHPTSYLGRDRWNAALDDAETNGRAALFTRGQASAFTQIGQVWAPRYRQATFGAFLTSREDAARALDLAYRDVAVAFDRFVEGAGDRPIVLAGHSQGALHLTRLLKERVAGTPLAERVVAAYAIGWPISVPADLPVLGLPQCEAADQAGCLISYQSFTDDGDPSLVFDAFDATPGLAGAPRAGTPVVCTNPLTGAAGGSAPMEANLGTLVPSEDLSSGSLTPAAVPATCEGRGLLRIGEGPELGAYVLPGGNYHVYDYSLFWANLRADAARRLAAYQAR